MMSLHDIHSSTRERSTICPQCKTAIKLTEPLAALSIETTRQRYEQKLPRRRLMPRTVEPRFASGRQIEGLDIPLLYAPKSDSEGVT